MSRVPYDGLFNRDDTFSMLAAGYRRSENKAHEENKRLTRYVEQLRSENFKLRDEIERLKTANEMWQHFAAEHPTAGTRGSDRPVDALPGRGDQRE